MRSVTDMNLPWFRSALSKTAIWWCGVTLVTLSVFACGTSPVLTTYEGDEQIVTFMQRDYTRLYRVYVPERTELGPAAPLVLAFHGSSQNGDQFRAQSGLDAAADAATFVVVYMESALGAWDVFGVQKFLGLDELAYVREVIDRVDRDYVIDRRRVIAVGLSNGGVMSQQLGCKLADRLAGFVSVAASMSRPMMDQCTPSEPISALYLLGTADSFFPVAGNQTLLSADSTMLFWKGANGCSGSRNRSTLPDVHDDGTVVYRSQYRSCNNDTRTELDSIVGGGHAWPDGVIPAPAAFGPTSRDISANSEIIRFLESIPRN